VDLRSLVVAFFVSLGVVVGAHLLLGPLAARRARQQQQDLERLEARLRVLEERGSDGSAGSAPAGSVEARLAAIEAALGLGIVARSEGEGALERQRARIRGAAGKDALSPAEVERVAALLVSLEDARRGGRAALAEELERALGETLAPDLAERLLGEDEPTEDDEGR
jgi:hypothetical protein